MSNQPGILIVEDDFSDADLIYSAIRDQKIRDRIHTVNSGEEALNFLRRAGLYRDAPRVNLVLLDLNLPEMDGFTVLKEIRKDPDLTRLPVIVLSGSERDEDKLASYDLQANCIIRKPADGGQFIRAVQMIETFWFKIVRLPPVP